MRSRNSFGVKISVLALVLASACGGTPGTRTHIARNETPVFGVPAYDAFFRTIHNMQLALNESERVKTDALRRLALSLGLEENASLASSASTVRARVQRLQEAGIHVRFAYTTTDPTDSPAPTAAASSSSPPPSERDVFPESQQHAESDVHVDMPVEGSPLTPDARALFEAVAQVIRSSAALMVRLQSIARLAPDINAAGKELMSEIPQRITGSPTAVTAELREALDFLDGAGARASALSQETVQVALRIQASANLTPTE